jgi:hypothetical protein
VTAEGAPDPRALSLTTATVKLSWSLAQALDRCDALDPGERGRRRAPAAAAAPPAR